MNSPVKPFQKYVPGSHTYQVEYSTEMNLGNLKKYQSSFKIIINETENEDHTKNWLIDKHEDGFVFSENSFIEILQKLEQCSYPLTIKVDDRGVFLRTIYHHKSVEKWKSKTLEGSEKYDNFEIFRSQYLIIMENEELFYKNKLREPFWNLLLFAPSYMNNGDRNNESIIWNIKGIGNVQCDGSIKAEKRNYGFEAYFTSKVTGDELLTKKLNEKYSASTNQFNIELNINMEYNSSKKQYIKKKAVFILSDGEKILYREICSII
jgi:hypothetical protein